MSWILYVLLVLAVAGDILLAVVLAKVMHKNDEPQQKIDTADDFVRAVTPVLQSETDLLAEQLRAMQGESARTTTATLRDFSAVLAENQRQNAAASTARLESIDRAGAARQKAANDALLAQLTMMETRLKNLEDSNATRMDSVRGALVQGLNTIRADNNKKLDEIRGTVEEKLQDTLQQRINDSFKTVSAQLEQVYKGLGEMQNLAADVGSLKQVLSGVKTRGILGEVQLGAILEQILAPGQYACNVATVPGSTNRVEYAIKMPGQNGTVWLPIDAKFPGDTYAHLQAAQERGDAAAVAAMRKALNNVLRAEAKDIHDKYIEVPYTTSFGILFLPFEGLYAEVVSSGVGKGSSIRVVTDATVLAERADQSTWPITSVDENGLLICERGPHNIIRTCCEFAIEERSSCEVYIGSPAEIAATARAKAAKTVEASDLMFLDDISELPVLERLRVAADAGELQRVSASLGLDMSERTAHRIVAGQVKPQRSVVARLTHRAGPKVPHEVDLTRDHRGLKISKEDCADFSRAMERGFSELAQKYYLSLNEAPKVRVGKGKITVTFELEQGD